MANSSSNIDQLSQSQSSKEITINALLDAASPATLYGRRQSTTSGLTWGYYGGTILLGTTATQIANGTLTLPASTTNYIQANPSSGAVTSNTSGFTVGYWQLYVVVTGASTVTSYTDNRVLGQSLTGGFTNPMTAAGDLIIGGTSGAATRLGIGSTGFVLTVVGGVPVWAVVPAATIGSSTLTDFANAAGTTTGLTYGYNAGTIRSDNATVAVAAGTLTLAASITNYIEVTGAGAVSSNTTGFTSGRWPICTVATGASTITTITDKRGFASVTGPTTPDELVNAQTGTSYTYVTGDKGKLVTHSNAGAIAGTLPQAGASFPAGWWMDVQNRGAGTLTITPTTSTIDGASSFALTTGQGCRIASDGTNYFTQRGAGSGGGSFTGGTLTSALNEAPPVTIASSATVAIGAAAANSITVSGTTTITAFDSIAAGAFRRVVFSGALVLTHNATSLILPSAANITTVAGDVAEFLSLGSGNWRCTSYSRASGSALVSSGGGGLTNWTDSVNSATPNATIPVAALTVTNAATNVDAAVIAKGTGATLAQIPDNTATGGNKRGAYSVDWQKWRGNATSVASGAQAVIGGGYDNTASGASSTVSGGQSCTASANNATVGGGYTNHATATYTTIAGGENNTASTTDAAVGGGSGNTSSGSGSVVAGGVSNVASGQQGTVGGGSANTAGGTYSTISGGANGTTRGITGAEAYGSGLFSAAGDAQRRRFILRWATTDATPSALTADLSGVNTSNQVVLPNNGTFDFSVRVVARSSADQKSFLITGLITRGANAASTALVGTPTVTTIANSGGASAWTVAVSADTTNGCLAITVTGAAATNIKWVADAQTVEVVG